MRQDGDSQSSNRCRHGMNQIRDDAKDGHLQSYPVLHGMQIGDFVSLAWLRKDETSPLAILR